MPIHRRDGRGTSTMTRPRIHDRYPERMCGCSGNDNVGTLPTAGGGYLVQYTVNGQERTERYGSFIPAQRRKFELGGDAVLVDAN